MDYLYFTITQDSNVSSQALVQHYELDKMHSWKNNWDKGQTNDEGTYQFEQMCIRLDIGEVEYWADFTQQISIWLHSIYHKTAIHLLPSSFQKSLHLVTHGSNHQEAGFHLSHALLGDLGEKNIDFYLHGYLDQNDEAEHFPFSKKIQIEQEQQEITEYAYFWLSSDTLKAADLQQILPNLEFSVTRDQGENISNSRPLKNSTNSNIKLVSPLCPEKYQLNAHLNALIQMLQPYQASLQQLFFDAQISFGINATGHLENPHHRHITSETIKALFLLGCELDADFYFN